jgi:putative ABC transport system permease protein
VTRLMSALLFAVEPTDAVTFVLVSTALLATAAIACFVPASRLTSIDPVRSLRFE